LLFPIASKTKAALLITSSGTPVKEIGLIPSNNDYFQFEECRNVLNSSVFEIYQQVTHNADLQQNINLQF